MEAVVFVNGVRPVWMKELMCDPLSRQIKEAILIDSHGGLSMNDKCEFFRPTSVILRAKRS